MSPLPNATKPVVIRENPEGFFIDYNEETEEHPKYGLILEIQRKYSEDGKLIELLVWPA